MEKNDWLVKIINQGHMKYIFRDPELGMSHFFYTNSIKNCAKYTHMLMCI